MTDVYVASHRSRYQRPRRNQDRWYRCRCGRWWGINKKYLCVCNAYPRSYGATTAQQEAWDREAADHRERIGDHEEAAAIRRWLP